MESKYPISTPSGPVTTLAIKIDGTPISIVSGSASARLKATGRKSAATCELMANSAGRESCGEILPLPISVPISTPTTYAITAPGPKIGDKNGILQINDNTNKPGSVPASGVRKCAMISPIPEVEIIPTNADTKIMKGSTVCRIISTVSLPA